MRLNIILALLLTGCTAQAGDKLNLKTRVETNSWDAAISQFELGLRHVPDFGNYVAFNNNFMIMSATNCISVGYGYYPPQPCRKDHIEDYPKSNIVVKAVQRVVEFDTTAENGESKATAHWIQYEYPHTKITEISTTVVEIKTTVATNTVAVSEPGVCTKCKVHYVTTCPKCGRKDCK